MTTSAASLTPAFYRMFAEGTRNAVWLSVLDGAYLSLERAAGTGTGRRGRSPGGRPGSAPLLVLRGQGRAGGAAGRSQLAEHRLRPRVPRPGLAAGPRPALERRAPGPGAAGPGRPHPGARPDPAPPDRRHVRPGRRAGSGAETARYGALAGIALPELDPALLPALRGKLEPQPGGQRPRADSGRHRRPVAPRRGPAQLLAPVVAPGGPPHHPQRRRRAPRPRRAAPPGATSSRRGTWCRGASWASSPPGGAWRPSATPARRSCRRAGGRCSTSSGPSWSTSRSARGAGRRWR